MYLKDWYTPETRLSIHIDVLLVWFVFTQIWDKAHQCNSDKKIKINVSFLVFLKCNALTQ